MRAWCLRAHRWLGLIIGFPFFLIAVSGAIYTWEPELRVITMRQQVEPRDAPLATAAALRDAARAAVPNGDLRTLLWRGRDRTVEALIYVPGTSFNVQLDPYDARVVHVQDMKRGWLNGVRDLHRSLLLGDPGKTAGHAVVVVYLVLIITGVWLRRPWRRAAATQRKGRWFRWHLVLGYHGSVVALLSVSTGLYWALGFVQDGLRYATGEAQQPTPPPLSVVPAAGEPRPGPWPLIQRLSTTMAELHPTADFRISVPHKATDPITVAIVQRDHRAATTVIRPFDRFSGEPIAVPYTAADGDTRSRFNRAASWVYDVHFGTWLGWPGRVLMCASSLLAATLPLSGIVLWWRGRKRTPRGMDGAVNPP